jgi:outer membrane murein-binding lipoprotein Lpp
MIIIMIFVSALSMAGLRDPDHWPNPKPQRCDQRAVNACIHDHRTKISQLNSSQQTLQEKISIIARDLEHVSRQQSSLAAEESSAKATERLAKAEIDDISRPATESPPVFPSGPTPENIFFLDQQLKLGVEPLAEARKQRLQTLSILSITRVKELEPSLRKLAMEISNLGSETEALLREKSHLEAAVNSHARMCDYGCKEQICPEF